MQIKKIHNPNCLQTNKKNIEHSTNDSLIFPKTGDFLREKYDEATQVKLNKRGHLQVKDNRYKVPTANDLVYLDESPDWCRNTKQLQWPGKSFIYLERFLLIICN